jgi:hypothetical protein
VRRRVWLVLGLALPLPAMAAVAVPAPAAPAGGQACPGSFRWSVKTLSDPRAVLVNYSPTPTTVTRLRRIPRPSTPIGADTPRLPGAERRTYRVRVRLVKFALEADGDFHLIVKGLSTSGTMVTELPDPNCDGAAHSAKRAQMAAARQALIRACGMPTSSFRALSGAATITGVGFFDEIHDVSGQDPHFLELHPLLSFAGSCHRPLPVAARRAPLG